MTSKSAFCLLKGMEPTTSKCMGGSIHGNDNISYYYYDFLLYPMPDFSG